MSTATATTTAPAAAHQETPTRSLWARAVRVGLVAGAVSLYLVLTGIIERFSGRNVITGVVEFRGVALLTMGQALLVIVGLAAGYLVARRGEGQVGAGARVGAGVLAGALAGVIPGLLLVTNGFLADQGANMREILVSVSPRLVNEVLSFGLGPFPALMLLTVVSAALGGLGAAGTLLGDTWRRPVLLGLAWMILIALAEPLLQPSLRGLNIERSWLYERGGLAPTGAVIVFLVAVGIQVLRGRSEGLIAGLSARVGTPERPKDSGQEWFGWSGLLDRGALWLGVASVILSLALAAQGIFAPPVNSRLLFVGLIVDALAIGFGAVAGRIATLSGAPKNRALMGVIAGGVGLTLILPWIAGRFVSDVMGTVGLYVLLGLGLNIVVGYAGLLDLGYVAFFAVGAYSAALMTSTRSPLVLGTEQFQRSAGGGVPAAPSGWIPGPDFWVAIPIVVVIAVIVGILIGAPVLRLRGDYLAIVTLGFGEIIRTLVLSDWLRPFLGGAQGITSIPAPPIAGLDVSDERSPQVLYYVILVFVLIAALISARLKESRVGRAWAAMREDEQVAEAMGISVVKYKLLAFGIGAGIACLGGAFFAVKLTSIFPHSFGLLVSINALAVIILGGMGSIPGVIVGSLVLVGLPEFLREFGEYRLLFYGAILVAIMILKPEGLIPEVRRRRELHERELEEEQFEVRTGDEESPAPVITTASPGDEASR
jgi:branched-chain amino acid transport system permease protein